MNLVCNLAVTGAYASVIHNSRPDPLSYDPLSYPLSAIFKSCGCSLADLAVGELVLERA